MFKANISLWSLFVLQAFCAIFFALEAGVDFMGWEPVSPLEDSDVFEYVVSIALIISVVFTGRELLKMVKRQSELSKQISIASGAFAELLEEHFITWSLTASEQEVAILAIKGLSIADIARLRDTKEGTVKAQCAAVYRKAGVTGRLQLLSYFIEELMSENLIDQPAI